MALSPTIPQDIIEEIVHYLRYDPTTLKICRFVSRTFSPPSRRQLFSRIVLNTSHSLCRLDRLLKRSPEIANLVCTVQIHIHIIPYSSIPSLSAVLQQFTQLRHLVIGSDGNYFDWSYISPENEESLRVLITSKTLLSLEFICVYHVPTTLIRAASSIMFLKLEVSVLYEDTDINNLAAAPHMKLETLHLGFEVVLGVNYWSPFITPNLRQLSVSGFESHTHKNMQEIIRAASGSIQDIIWYEYSKRFSQAQSNIDFGVLSNLMYLSFVTSDFSRLTGKAAEMTLQSIVSKLEDPATVGNLKRLSIVITTSGTVISRQPGPLLGVNKQLWKSMDNILADTSHCAKLRQVMFYLDYVGCRPAVREERLHTILAKRLPRLNQRNLLSVKIYRDLDWTILL